MAPLKTYSVALLQFHHELLVTLIRVEHLLLACVKQDLENRNGRVSYCSLK